MIACNHPYAARVQPRARLLLLLRTRSHNSDCTCDLAQKVNSLENADGLDATDLPLVVRSVWVRVPVVSHLGSIEKQAKVERGGASCASLVRLR